MVRAVPPSSGHSCASRQLLLQDAEIVTGASYVTRTPAERRYDTLIALARGLLHGFFDVFIGVGRGRVCTFSGSKRSTRVVATEIPVTEARERFSELVASAGRAPVFRH